MEDESFENLCMLIRARVDLCEQGVGLHFLHDYIWLGTPQFFIRLVQCVPVADFHLIHEQLLGDGIHFELQRKLGGFRSMAISQLFHIIVGHSSDAFLEQGAPVLFLSLKSQFLVLGQVLFQLVLTYGKAVHVVTPL